jgi:hypothetical protein
VPDGQLVEACRLDALLGTVQQLGDDSNRVDDRTRVSRNGGKRPGPIRTSGTHPRFSSASLTTRFLSVSTWPVQRGVSRVKLVSDTQAGSPPSLVPTGPETGSLFVFSILTVAATVLDGSLLAPLYSLCLYLDVRTLHQYNSNRIPNRVRWGVVAVLHFGSCVLSAV